LKKNVTASLKEENIFSIFKRAKQVVSEVSPIKDLHEKLDALDD